MDGPYLIESVAHTAPNKPGTLRVLGQDGLPFPVRRVFWIDVPPPGGERGGHAHRSCDQVFVAQRGKMTVECTWYAPASRTRVFLLREGQAVVVPPMTHSNLVFPMAGATCLVLCSEPFSDDSYIYGLRDLQKFSSGDEEA